MDKLIDQGVLGIVVGIVTTAILFGLKVFWTTRVTPYLTRLKYQGVEIDGQWSGSTELTEDDIAREKLEAKPFKTDFKLFLEQNAHTLSGTFTFNFAGAIKDFSLDFKVNGYMWEGYVTLNFTPKDRRVTSYATGLFKLHDGGYSLVGSWLFRDVEYECVTQTLLTLTRIASK